MGSVPGGGHEPLEILGVRVCPLDTPEVLCAVETMVSDERAHHIVTVNPEFVVRARRDAKFRSVLNSGDLATVDGVGIALGLRLLYGVRARRVTGADLMIELARLAAEKRWPVFLLGAMPGVAELAARKLRQLAPGLLLAGTWSGGPDPSEDEGIREMISAGGTRLLFVAYGAPAQEYWIRRNLRRLGPCVAVGVGGSFDYLAETVPRAPEWLRNVGFEWLYRLVRQPSRWRRQMALPVFAFLLLRAWVAKKRSGANDGR